MTLSRSTRSVLLLLLLLVTAAGAYLYRNLDAIVKRQVQESLGELGVRDYQLTKPRLGTGRFTAARLTLHGRHAGLDYELALQNLDIRYDWRTLLTRKLRRVSLSHFEARAAGVLDRPADDPTPGTRTIDISNLTPRALLAGLPARAIEIDRLRLEYRVADDPLLVGTGHLRCGDGLDISVDASLAGAGLAASARAVDANSPLLLEFSLAEGPAPLATIRGQLASSGRDTLQWHIDATWDHAPLLHWLRRLAASVGEPAPEIVAQGAGELVASVRHPRALEVGPGSLWEQLQPVEAEAHVTGTVEGLDLPGLTRGELTDLDVTLSLADGTLQLVTAPLTLTGDIEASVLPVSAETRRWLRLGETVPVHWHNRAPLRIRLDGGKGSLQLPEATLQLGNDQSRLDVHALELLSAVTAGSTREADTRLSARIDTRLRKQKLPSLELALQLEGPVERTRANLALRAAEGDIGLQAAGRLDLPKSEGKMELAVRSDNLAGLPPALLPALQGLDMLGAELVLEAGSLAMESQLDNSGGAWIHTSRLALEGASGHYGEYRFDSLSVGGAVTGGSGLRTIQPLSLSAERLNVGFDITDIAAVASMPRESPVAAPALSLEAFSADLFGGKVFLPGPGRWDFGADRNTLTLRAEHWQLGQIVALQQSEDIQARGVLEGELPVTLEDGRLTIDKGYLRALPPGGSIRYIANDASQALGRSSKELALALGLLSDFRYEVLSSDVDLDKSGNLLLGLSLSGHNPAQYEGRTVNFNINLEQNLDPLLQSLRLSGKLTGEIENRLR